MAKKRLTTVGAGRPTGVRAAGTTAEYPRPAPRVGTSVPTPSANAASTLSSKLLVFKVLYEDEPLRALLDSGASNNFIRRETLQRLGLINKVWNVKHSKLSVRLANGASVESPKQVVRLRLTLDSFEFDIDFVVFDLDERFDVILGMPWLTRHQPSIDWKAKSIRVEPTLARAELADDEGNPSSFSHRDDAVPSESDGPEIGTTSECQQTIGLVDTVPGVQPCTKTRKSCLRKTTSCRRGRPVRRVRFEADHLEATTNTTTHSWVSVHSVEDTSPELKKLENPPTSADELCRLPVMSHAKFLKLLKRDNFDQVCVITLSDHSNEHACGIDPHAKPRSQQATDTEQTKIERFQSQGWEALSSSPFNDLLNEYRDVFPDEIPLGLPQDRGIRHEIDLTPGTKYCVTRQWPLPRDQVEAIDDFFEKRRLAGHVRESKSPHCTPTFCVRKATGGWRIVHAYNKLNDATIPAQTPIPRKDVIVDSMAGSTIFSTVDLTDSYYQILMREEDVPLTAVSTPSGMLWEWLVMPQGLKNAPATFNRCVSHILRPVRSFAPSYFDDVFIHSKASDGMSEVEVHRRHLRKVLELMREHKLYANIRKCIFGASEIPILGCLVGKKGVRPDPEKIKAIVEWPVPRNVNDLRKFLGLANYLHKYSKNNAHIVYPLTQLLRKDAPWDWSPMAQESFESVKLSLTEAPILAIADQDKPFHVVCDASNIAIGCALLQHDSHGQERVVSYQSRQLKPAERNYPVHDRELLAMKYALAKFRVYLLGTQHFTVFTDHCSLRTAIKSPHLSQRMARWLSFFAEYNFTVEYKPGKLNVLADALSRRPDFESDYESDSRVDANAITRWTSSLHDDIKRAYGLDHEIKPLLAYLANPTEVLKAKLPPSTRARLHRFTMHDGLIYFSTDDGAEQRVLVPNDADLRTNIMYEYHDTPTSGHVGREKTYVSLARDFHWSNMDKWVRKYVRTCEVCQRVKASSGSKAPLRSLSIPKGCWKSISLDFVFGLPKDKRGRDGILVIVDRFSKMVHLTAVSEHISGRECAKVFLDTVFRLHGLPEEIISDRDPRFTRGFWKETFSLLGTHLKMSTTDHPETDGQTERVNRSVITMLRGYAHSFESWSDYLPMVEFAINNSTHASTGLTPFFVNGMRHPSTPPTLGDISRFSVGGSLAVNSKSFPPSDTITDLAGIETAPKVDDLSATEQIPKCEGKLHPSTRRTFDAHTKCASDSSGSTVRSHSKCDLKGTSSYKKYELKDTKQSGEQNKCLYFKHYKNNKNAGDYSTAYATTTRLSDSVHDSIMQRAAIIRYVRDVLARSVDRQKHQADKSGRNRTDTYAVGSQVLLSTANLAPQSVSNLGSNKLIPRFIGPFKVIHRQGDAYTLDLPSVMKVHPTFYVGRLKPYRPSHNDAGANTSSHQSGSTAPGLSSPDARRAPGNQRVDRAHVGDQSPTYPLASLKNRVRDRDRKPARAPRVTSRGDPILGKARAPPPPVFDTDGTTRYIVERLTSHRDQRPPRRRHSHSNRSDLSFPKDEERETSRSYLVKWLGYPIEQSSWEPRSHLVQEVPDLVHEYEQTLPSRARLS